MVISLASGNSQHNVLGVQPSATIASYTPEEYLALERSSETKYEYFDGDVFALAGGSPEHSLIAANLIGELRHALRSRGCVVYTSDLKVHVEATGLCTHPDVTAASGEARFVNPNQECLANPTLIAEVLSKTTEAYDRGAKFEQYQAIPSLATYLLIAEDRPRIEQFVRKEPSGWHYSTAHGIGSSIELPALNITLALREIFAGVRFRAGAARAQVPSAPAF